MNLGRASAGDRLAGTGAGPWPGTVLAVWGSVVLGAALEEGAGDGGEDDGAGASAGARSSPALVAGGAAGRGGGRVVAAVDATVTERTSRAGARSVRTLARIVAPASNTAAAMTIGCHSARRPNGLAAMGATIANCPRSEARVDVIGTVPASGPV